MQIQRFSTALIANMLAFAVIGICGVAMNLSIGRFYGASELGIFNQLFAIYIFSAQLIVFGVQFSVLKHVSEFSDQPGKCANIFYSGITIVIVFGGGIALLLSWLLPLGLAYFESTRLQSAVNVTLIGAFAFALNKVALNTINGLSHFVWFATLQATRVVLMFSFVLACLIAEEPGELLIWSLAFAESSVLVLALSVLFGSGAVKGAEKVLPVSRQWLIRHWQFGRRAVLGGSISEVNTRLDLLALGWFLSDALVGLYSMAAVIAEGMVQLVMVVRNLINPRMTFLYTRGKLAELRAFTGSVKRYTYLAFGLAAFSAVAVYPYFISFFLSQEFAESSSAFTVLVVGLALFAGYLPFDTMLSQLGRPTLHTQVKVASTLTNLGLNIALIPMLGLIGAAIATAASYAVTAVMVRYHVQVLANFDL